VGVGGGGGTRCGMSMFFFGGRVRVNELGNEVIWKKAVCKDALKKVLMVDGVLDGQRNKIEG
jgi:hypothetical protein